MTGSGDLPTGMITFLFTDVVGSTRLWEEDPRAMRIAMVRHDFLIEAALSAHHGVPIKPRGEGDSRFAVFDSAPDAARAAVDIQRAFARAEWPTPGPMRLRMALNTGEADLREGDYYGTTVNRCARLRAIGHPGQILLAARTADLVRQALPSRTRLVGLGTHHLKDLTESESVFQLCHPELGMEFPPLRSGEAASTGQVPLWRAGSGTAFAIAAYRVLVLVDAPETAPPLVAVACGLAAAESPAEVVLTRFRPQPEEQEAGAAAFAGQLELMTETLDELHGLEEQVKARGLRAAAFCRFSDDFVGDLATQAEQASARLVVVGDRSADPEWESIIATITERMPCRVAVVVAPPALSRHASSANSPSADEAGETGRLDALELAVRTAISTTPVPGAADRDQTSQRPAHLETTVHHPGPGHPASSEPDVDLSSAQQGDLIRALSGGSPTAALRAARADSQRRRVPIVLMTVHPTA
jgi:class 3 adenylate cyclase